MCLFIIGQHAISWIEKYCPTIKLWIFYRSLIGGSNKPYQNADLSKLWQAMAGRTFFFMHPCIYTLCHAFSLYIHSNVSLYKGETAWSTSVSREFFSHLKVSQLQCGRGFSYDLRGFPQSSRCLLFTFGGYNLEREREIISSGKSFQDKINVIVP